MAKTFIAFIDLVSWIVTERPFYIESYKFTPLTSSSWTVHVIDTVTPKKLTI